MADNISTKNVWPNYHQSNVATASKRTATDTLGKDQFLKILVAQLSNQDPMQPMQDKDFIAQMAQFTSVEQLMNMSSELSLLRQNIGSASNIIGKSVEWYDLDEKGELIALSGIVDAVVLKEGMLLAKIGKNEVLIDHLISISEPKANGGNEVDPGEDGGGNEVDPGDNDGNEVDPGDNGDTDESSGNEDNEAGNEAVEP